MIDPKTGNIQLDDGRIISPSITKSELQAMKLGEYDFLMETNSNYWLHQVKNLKIGNHYFIFFFSFKGDSLRGTSLILQKETYNLKENSWALWSANKEMENLAYYKKWLDETLGDQREFDWGQVQAKYEKITAASSIKLLYNLEEKK